MTADRPWLRWGISFAVVVLVHLLGALAMLLWARQPPPVAQVRPPQAVMVELAPLPTAPPAPPTELPAGPRQHEAAATPPNAPTVPRLPPAPPVPPSPAVARAAATVPPDPNPAASHAAPSEAASASAPPQVAAAAGSRYAAQQSSAGSDSPLPADWQAQLLGHLERFKRYPRAAQRMRYQGVVAVRYRVDRVGNVLAVELARGSGHAPLDEEALAAVRRASPVPQPPADIPGDPVEVTTPVQFLLR